MIDENKRTTSGLELAADLHTHTVASGHAYSTVRENALYASQKGIVMIGVTDHGPAIGGGPHPFHFANLKALPEHLYGVRLLKGAEVNLTSPEGEVDLPAEILEQLEIVIGSWHSRQKFESFGVEENTRIIINLINNPFVQVLGHPDNPLFPTDYDKIAAAAKSAGVALELNNASLNGVARGGKANRDNCRRLAEAIKRQGAKIIISSDAHIFTRVGEFDEAVVLAESVGLTEADIINASEEKVKAFLEID